MPSSLHSKRYDQFRSLLIVERKEAELTQADIAEQLGKPQSYVAKYEGGERRLDLLEFLDVARIVGFEPSAFIKSLEEQTGGQAKK